MAGNICLIYFHLENPVHLAINPVLSDTGYNGSKDFIPIPYGSQGAIDFGGLCPTHDHNTS